MGRAWTVALDPQVARPSGWNSFCLCTYCRRTIYMPIDRPMSQSSLLARCMTKPLWTILAKRTLKRQPGIRSAVRDSMVKPPDTSDVPRKARAAYDSLPLRPTLSSIIGAKNAKKSCTIQAVQSLTAIIPAEAFNTPWRQELLLFAAVL